jgi:hypothetical protein
MSDTTRRNLLTRTAAALAAGAAINIAAIASAKAVPDANRLIADPIFDLIRKCETALADEKLASDAWNDLDEALAYEKDNYSALIDFYEDGDATGEWLPDGGHVITYRKNGKAVPIYATSLADVLRQAKRYKGSEYDADVYDAFVENGKRLLRNAARRRNYVLKKSGVSAARAAYTRAHQHARQELKRLSIVEPATTAGALALLAFVNQFGGADDTSDVGTELTFPILKSVYSRLKKGDALDRMAVQS